MPSEWDKRAVISEFQLGGIACLGLTEDILTSTATENSIVYLIYMHECHRGRVANQSKKSTPSRLRTNTK